MREPKEGDADEADKQSPAMRRLSSAAPHARRVADGAHGFFRRWMRKVWNARGGGLYAVGFAIAFLYFETRDILFDDIPTLATMGLAPGALVDFAIDFIIDTLMNTLYAFMWPAFVVQWRMPLGLVLLVAAFLLFPRVVKAPLENWLFEGEPAPEPRKKQKKKKA